MIFISNCLNYTGLRKQRLYPLSIKQSDFAVFNSSTSSTAVPELPTDSFLILLEMRRSTQVMSQTSCLPSSQCVRVIPSGRFPFDQVYLFGSKIEGTVMELSGAFSNIEVAVPRGTSHASGTVRTRSYLQNSPSSENQTTILASNKKILC